MQTLAKFSEGLKTIPAGITWYLADIAEAKGKQDLYTNYETLEISSQRWHEAKHDPWLYINFLLYILKKASGEFIERVEKIEPPKGAKTEFVIEQILKMNSEFTLSQLHSQCPGVSRDMVRKVLKDLQKIEKVVSTGRGVAARWRRKGNTSL